MKGHLIDQLLIQNPEEWANVQYLLDLASPKLVPGNSQFVVTIGKNLIKNQRILEVEDANI